MYDDVLLSAAIPDDDDDESAEPVAQTRVKLPMELHMCFHAYIRQEALLASSLLKALPSLWSLSLLSRTLWR